MNFQICVSIHVTVHACMAACLVHAKTMLAEITIISTIATQDCVFTIGGGAGGYAGPLGSVCT